MLWGRQLVMDKFIMSDELMNEGCRHCAALFITKPSVSFDLNKPAGEFDKSKIDRNGTITFLQYKNRTYGVTCKHVVDTLRKRNEKLNEREHFIFVTIVKKVVFHLDRSDKFFFSVFGGKAGDIAFCELPANFLNAIEKTPINIESCFNPPDITHAFAFGFPEEKVVREDVEGGHRWVMPCCFAAAKSSSVPEDIKKSGKMFLYSELDNTPDIDDLSGMSGGPVYWSDENRYGILGITCEAFPLAPNSESIGDKYKICLKVEMITKSIFDGLSVC